MCVKTDFCRQPSTLSEWVCVFVVECFEMNTHKRPADVALYVDRQFYWEHRISIVARSHAKRTSYCGALNASFMCWCVDCHGNGFPCFFFFLLNVFYRQIYLSRFRLHSLASLAFDYIQVFTLYCMHSKPGLDLPSHWFYRLLLQMHSLSVLSFSFQFSIWGVNGT